MDNPSNRGKHRKTRGPCETKRIRELKIEIPNFGRHDNDIRLAELVCSKGDTLVGKYVDRFHEYRRSMSALGKSASER